jgi:CheY-like chemotaxis protein/DNA-directed RNA polymerase subunit RPC12/RpoP
MKCPKCSASFDAKPDEGGIVLCPGCGAKLRGRPVAPSAEAGTLEAILAEIRVIRAAQSEILGLLRARSDGDSVEAEAPSADEEPVALPEIRARRRKTVLLIDDQDESRDAAVAALSRAEVPTRAVADGPKGLEALAAERPDVIALELGIGGSMGGKDVVNMIKSTMEWIDIPIVLYTRVPVASQKEARTVHGADEVVAKGPASADALVAKVIQLFRRG